MTNAAKFAGVGEIDVYADSDAQTVMKRMATLFTLCKSYKETYQGSKLTEHLVATKLPGLGSEAIKALVTSPFFDASLEERVIVCSSISKSHALPGFRAG